MTRSTHLVDTSAFARINQPLVAAALESLAMEGCLALCAPTIFELGYGARSHDDYEALMRLIDAFDQAPVTEGDHRRALEVQHQLSATGRHRGLSLVDALVAAVAESRSLTVLHYDADFDLVASATGQPTEWVVERGTVD